MGRGVPARDLLGRDLTAAETRLFEAYLKTKSLLDEDTIDDGLAPCVRANVAEAVAALWQALHDLALTDERPRT